MKKKVRVYKKTFKRTPKLIVIDIYMVAKPFWLLKPIVSIIGWLFQKTYYAKFSIEIDNAKEVYVRKLR